MSEEEIIQTLENRLNSWNNIKEDCKNSELSNVIDQIEKDNQATQGLLDLYNKQKEENKKDVKGYSKMINSLEEQLASKVKEIEQLKNAEEYSKLGKEELLDTIHKQKEEIEELKRDYEIITDDMKNHNVVYTDMPEFEEKYISKDKIRDKIKEYREQRIKLADGHFFDNPDNTTNDFAFYVGQEVLKQLLEE